MGGIISPNETLTRCSISRSCSVQNIVCFPWINIAYQQILRTLTGFSSKFSLLSLSGTTFSLQPSFSSPFSTTSSSSISSKTSSPDSQAPLCFSPTTLPLAFSTPSFPSARFFTADISPRPGSAALTSRLFS